MFKERHVERIRKTYKKKKKKKKNTYILCLVSIIIFMLGLKFRSRLKLVLSFKVQETYIIYIISITKCKVVIYNYFVLGLIPCQI